jgi:hypothetical protein
MATGMATGFKYLKTPTIRGVVKTFTRQGS